MMLKKYISALAVTALSLVPAFAYAQDAFSITSRVIGQLRGIVDTALPVVFSLAILAFFWGIFRYVFSKSGDDKIEGKNVMLWSLVALFVMASVYGIIALAQTTLGIPTSSNPVLHAPQIGH